MSRRVHFSFLLLCRSLSEECEGKGEILIDLNDGSKTFSENSANEENTPEKSERKNAYKYVFARIMHVCVCNNNNNNNNNNNEQLVVFLVYG